MIAEKAPKATFFLVTVKIDNHDPAGVVVLRSCPQCGRPVYENWQFCNHCGSRLTEHASTPYNKKANIHGMNRRTTIAIAAVFVSIIFIVIAVFFVFPWLTGSGITPPSVPKVITDLRPETPRDTVVIPHETEPPVFSIAGIIEYIRYLGSWKAPYRMPDTLQTLEKTDGGQIDDGIAEKIDSLTGHALASEIKKDEISLTNDSNSGIYENISLADTGTAWNTTVKTTAPAPQTVSPVLPLTNATITTSPASRTPAPVITAPVCSSDEVACKGLCTNTRTDNNNCGYCENSCPAGNYCLNGNCAVTCPAEQTSCPDGCLNLMTDPRHCGSCENSCPMGLICVMGRCDSPATPMQVPR
jgi:hypothetical protein